MNMRMKEELIKELDKTGGIQNFWLCFYIT